jgi:hypothetical protein
LRQRGERERGDKSEKHAHGSHGGPATSNDP